MKKMYVNSEFLLAGTYHVWFGCPCSILREVQKYNGYEVTTKCQLSLLAKGK